ncbi:MAG: PEP-CTERM sorting domain-containing protein, partial [Planctomycetales bacterium]|nr:PEP-CTERM sorting domain-containing protein [Planctomycetales bacterium]
SAAVAAIDGAADSSTFSNQYDGDQIFDGSAAINAWVINGGNTAAAYELSGSNLVVSADANNGWVEHDNDSTPWESSAGNWTVEISAKLNNTDDAVNDGLVIWGERDGNRGVLWIQGESVTDISGNVIADGLVNTNDFHTYRVAYDSADALHHVWRDGELLSGAGVDINLAGGNNSRLIIGDCCTGIGNPVDQYELGYVRYQADQALSVVPEPSSFLLAIFGGLALLATRRLR